MLEVQHWLLASLRQFLCKLLIASALADSWQRRPLQTRFARGRLKLVWLLELRACRTSEHSALFILILADAIHYCSQDKGGPSQSEEIANSYPAKDCPKPMGWTSENVASDFNISRNEMDDWAARSFQRAERAQKAGLFDREIVPFTAYKKDASGARVKVVLTKDDGIRYGTTKESLSKIKAAFPQWGRALTTGGNASQITDGAAAVLLMTRRKAQELGLAILAKHISTAVTGKYLFAYHIVSDCIHIRAPSGVAPRIMGIAPVAAIKMVLVNTGVSISDIDLFEVTKAAKYHIISTRGTSDIISDKRGIRFAVCVLRQRTRHRP